MFLLERSDKIVKTPGEQLTPFVFYTERRLVGLTGRKARNLGELLRHLREVSGSSIFYHTHYLYLVHHFEKPRFYNEFANWVSQALQEERLAERLAAIDLLANTPIRGLPEVSNSSIEDHFKNVATPPNLPSRYIFPSSHANPFTLH